MIYEINRHKNDFTSETDYITIEYNVKNPDIPTFDDVFEGIEKKDKIDNILKSRLESIYNNCCRDYGCIENLLNLMYQNTIDEINKATNDYFDEFYLAGRSNGWFVMLKLGVTKLDDIPDDIFNKADAIIEKKFKQIKSFILSVITPKFNDLVNLIFSNEMDEIVFNLADLDDVAISLQDVGIEDICNMQFYLLKEIRDNSRIYIIKVREYDQIYPIKAYHYLEEEKRKFLLSLLEILFKI